jgi:GntR family colanic acid and biofilm gene transcriptional regulator
LRGGRIGGTTVAAARRDVAMDSDFIQAPKGGLAGFAERSLKQALLDGRLRPGERLVTRELAARLGTSPTPVREALLKLVAGGVLEVAPSQAFQVPVLDAARYLELADIRRLLEGMAAERATLRIVAADIAALAEINDRFQAAKLTGDVPAALAHNRAFRFGLYEHARMPALLEMIERLWLQIGPTLNYLYPQRRPAVPHQHNYDRLLEALARQDPAAVRAAIDQAIDDGNAILLANIEGSGNPEMPAFALP